MTVNVGKTEANKDLPFIKWLTELPHELALLPKWKSILFIASCCERLYGNYVRFHEETGWGKPSALCEGIHQLSKTDDPPDDRTLRSIYQRVELATPNTEDFSSEYTSAALDAATAVIESINYYVDDDLSHCVRVACLCRDSIYMFVQLREGLDYSDADERRIYDDPLMIRELAAQKKELELLKKPLDDGGLRRAVRPLRCDPMGGSLGGPRGGGSGTAAEMNKVPML